MRRLVKLSGRTGLLAAVLLGAASIVLVPATGASAATCVPGVGEQLAAVFDSSPATQAPTALVGAVLEYQVIVRVNASPTGCPFSGGTVTLTTPDGASHTLATGLSLNPGDSVTYYTDNNGGGTSIASPFTYTVNAADIGKTNGDPGGSSLPPGDIDVWSSVSGTSGSATGHASPDYYTTVLFPPTLTTTEVTSSPAVAPASFTDSASLSGLSEGGPAGGTVTYNLYSGNSSSSCTGDPLQSLIVTVSAGKVPNATFTSVGAGNYEIQAVYSGDPQTSNAPATSACGAEAFTVVAPTAPSGPTTTTTTTTTPPVIAGATVVQTGEPWSGSGPFALAVALLGAGLTGLGLLLRRRSHGASRPIQQRAR